MIIPYQKYNQNGPLALSLTRGYGYWNIVMISGISVCMRQLYQTGVTCEWTTVNIFITSRNFLLKSKDGF